MTPCLCSLVRSLSIHFIAVKLTPRGEKKQQKKLLKHKQNVKFKTIFNKWNVDFFLSEKKRSLLPKHEDAALFGLTVLRDHGH